MANQYGLYLARERTVLRFPMNPESYQIQRDTENGEYNVLGIGPVMVPRTPKLQRISWSGLLPASGEWMAVVTSGGFQPPQFYLEFLQAAMAEKAVLRFVANRYMEDGTPIFDTNLEVLVTSLSFEERGAETGDFYYDLTP